MRHLYTYSLEHFQGGAYRDTVSRARDSVRKQYITLQTKTIISLCCIQAEDSVSSLIIRGGPYAAIHGLIIIHVQKGILTNSTSLVYQ